MTSSQEMERV